MSSALSELNPWSQMRTSSTAAVVSTRQSCNGESSRIWILGDTESEFDQIANMDRIPNTKLFHILFHILFKDVYSKEDFKHTHFDMLWVLCHLCLNEDTVISAWSWWLIFLAISAAVSKTLIRFSSFVWKALASARVLSAVTRLSGVPRPVVTWQQ